MVYIIKHTAELNTVNTSEMLQIFLPSVIPMVHASDFLNEKIFAGGKMTFQN